MPSITLNLRGDGAWPDLQELPEDRVVHLRDPALELAVLEHGMESGKPSVALRVDLPDGKVAIIETSWAILAAAARGVAARYGWP